MVTILAVVLTIGAQAQTGTIIGKVTDQSGGAIPGATISAMVGERRQTTVTNVAGEYQIARLVPGNYQVEARMAGFVLETMDSLSVGPGQPATWNVVMRVIQQPDPFAQLSQEVQRLTGPQALDCGKHYLIQQGRRWVAADADRLQRSLDCALDASKKMKAFYTFKQDQGIDSTIATGLIGGTAGVILRFSFDSAPCGGPGCAPTFRTEQCDGPAVTTYADGRAMFTCRR